MKEVLDIPLSKSPLAKDKLLWPYAQSGSNSVKQGYKALYKEMEDQNHIHKVSDITPELRNTLWKTQLPLRIISLTWKNLHKGNPKKEELNRREFL